MLNLIINNNKENDIVEILSEQYPGFENEIRIDVKKTMTLLKENEVIS